MNKETFLHIQEPCNENWNAMTTAEQGRFCQSCCKTVVDFTQLSDKQILQVLSKAAGKTCGRFTEEQLHRPLQDQKQTLLRPHKLFLSALIPTFFITNSAVAQQQKPRQVAKPETEKIGATMVKGTPSIVEKDLEELRAQKLGEVQVIKAVPEKLPEEERIIMGKIAVPLRPCPKDEIPSVADIKLAETERRPLINAYNSIRIDNKLTGVMGGLQVYKKVTAADTIKTFVRKAFNQQAFKIAANPARRGGDINIQFREAGSYTLQLLDAAGRLYLSKIAQAENKRSSITLKLPDNALPGNYFLKVISSSKKTYTDNLFIQ